MWVYTVNEADDVTIGKYIPWLKVSTLQYISVYHDW
jgi:hypothetical protein